jgi:hypothetical protein
VSSTASSASNGLLGLKTHFPSWNTDKKENQIFLKYKEIQSGAVAKSYMRKCFLIYEEICNPYMRRSLVLYDFANAPF